MANWGVPDYDTLEVVDIEGLHKRILTEDPEALVEWPFKGPAGFDHATVKRYCVDTTEPFVAEWQRTRLFMKGKTTHYKLAILHAWYSKYQQHENTQVCYAVEVQVYNYLGALRRGGQLDENNRIRKYR